jgi:hypothetical protein
MLDPFLEHEQHRHHHQRHVVMPGLSATGLVMARFAWFLPSWTARLTQ